MRQSVHSLILNSDRTSILLVKRRDIPVWVLPGGGLEEGEIPEEGSLREGSEETGLKLEVVEKIGTYLPTTRLSDVSHLFECRAVEGTPEVTSETNAISWFSVHNLPPLPPPYPEWIRDAVVSPLSRPFTKKVETVNYPSFIYHSLTHPILMIRFLLSRIGIHLQ